MSHAIHEKQKLLNRVRRIRGQVEAAERAIEADTNCPDVMHLLVACRGAINGLLAEVLEDHVQEAVVGSGRVRPAGRAKAAAELIDIVHAYFR